MLAPNDKTVQIIVITNHHELKNVMKIGNRTIADHGKAPLYHGNNASEVEL